MEKCNLCQNQTCGTNLKPEVRPFTNNDLSEFITKVIKNK